MVEYDGCCGSGSSYVQGAAGGRPLVESFCVCRLLRGTAVCVIQRQPNVVHLANGIGFRAASSRCVCARACMRELKVKCTVYCCGKRAVGVVDHTPPPHPIYIYIYICIHTGIYLYIYIRYIYIFKKNPHTFLSLCVGCAPQHGTTLMMLFCFGSCPTKTMHWWMDGWGIRLSPATLRAGRPGSERTPTTLTLRRWWQRTLPLRR